MTINEALDEFFKEEDFYKHVIEHSYQGITADDEKFNQYINALDTIYGDSLRQSIQNDANKAKDENLIIQSIGV